MRPVCRHVWLTLGGDAGERFVLAGPQALDRPERRSVGETAFRHARVEGVGRRLDGASRAQRLEVDARRLGAPCRGDHASGVAGPRRAGPTAGREDLNPAIHRVERALQLRAVVAGEAQSPGEFHVAHQHRRVAVERGAGRQRHLDVGGARTHRRALHHVLAQERRGARARQRVPGRPRRRRARAEQGVVPGLRDAAAGGEVGRGAGLEPVAFALPRIGWQRGQTRAVFTQRGPRGRTAGRIQRAERSAHGRGFVVGAAQRRQRDALGAVLLQAVHDRRSQHRVRRDLHEVRDARVQDLPDAVAEAHRLPDGAPPVVGIARLAVGPRTRRVGEPRDARGASAQAGHRGQKLLLDRIHGRTVVRDRDRQHAREDLPCEQRGRDSLDRVVITRQGDGRRSVHGGERDEVLGAGEQRRDLVVGRAHRQHASGIRGPALQPAAVERQPHRLVEIVDPGDVGRGHRAAAVADHRRRRDAPRRPEIGESHLDREVGHLRQGGIGHPGRAFAGRQLVEERPVGQRPQCRVAALQHLPEDRLRLAQLPAHAPPLRPHPRAHERDGRRPGVRGPAGGQARAAAAVGEVAEQRGEVVRPARDDRQAQIVVRAALRAREAEIAQARRVGLAEPLGTGGGQILQGVGTARREHEQSGGLAFGRLGGLGRLGTRGRLLQQHMGVGAAKAERIHAGDGRLMRLRPGLQFRDHAQPQRLKVDRLIRPMKVQ